MKQTINIIKNRLLKFLNIGQAVEPAVDEKQEFLNQVRQAHRDWLCALNNFNYSSDGDMIDFHIYNIEAAEKKYMCLIKRARKEKLTADMPCDNIYHDMRPQQDC